MDSTEKNILNKPIITSKDIDGVETFYLFEHIKISKSVYDFLHAAHIFTKKIFSISNIDGHILIYVCGILIRKRYSLEAIHIHLTESGLNTTENRDTKIIASLTTFPARINTVEKTIKSLLTQTLKPDKLILWLAEEQFPNRELPKSLLALKKYGLSIKWCNDTKSYKKLVPTLKEYPDDIIITFDDDIYYDSNVIENLYNSYLKEPTAIHANRGNRVFVKNGVLKTASSAELYWTRFKHSSFKNTIIGCGGVLYPPHCLAPEITDEEKFTKFLPTQDDLWFWIMAVKNNTKIKIVSSYDMQIITVEDTQQYGLCKINVKGKNGLHARDGFALISEKCPDIVEKVKNENIYS